MQKDNKAFKEICRCRIMQKEKEFETEKYKFIFYQDRNETLMEVRPKCGEPRAEHEREIKGSLKHVGKWEVLIKAGRNLLEDLGIKKKSENKIEKEFEFEHIRTDKERILFKITSKRDINVKPSIEEIEEQVRNIFKWQQLTKTISEIKNEVFSHGF
jgi:hypothetical protein